MRTWFAAVWFVTSQKNGVSALGLQRALGLRSYETAWVWMHKLRRAMVVPGREMLSGTVEVDETYVGGISRGMAGLSTTKVPVMVQRRTSEETASAGSAWNRRRLALFKPTSSPNGWQRPAPLSRPTGRHSSCI